MPDRPKSIRSLPPVGVVLLGGWVGMSGLMFSYFAFAGAWEFGYFASENASVAAKAGAALSGAGSVLEAILGVLILLGVRSALRWAMWTELALIVIQLQSFDSHFAGDYFAMAGGRALTALLLALVARSARQAPRPIRVWRVLVLAAEVALAGVFLGGGVSLWASLPEGRELAIPPTTLRAAEALPREPFRVELPTLTDSRRAAWQEGPKVTLVNYWATWCGPCVAELPDLAKIAGGHPLDELSVVLIETSEEDAARLRAFLADRAPGVTCLQDHEKLTWSPIARALGRDAIPTTILLDADGRPVARWQGRRSLEDVEHEIGLVLSGLR